MALSLLFLFVYGGCNWITARRHDVGMFYFNWERSLPFVPLLILPYLSIDLFFVVAPFLCKTERELRVFAGRVTTAIVIAGSCFILFPLRFAFARPSVSGWTGALFDWFRGLDAPYNLLPSLHATFWLFLVQIYVRHTGGIARVLVLLWLALIGLSPVLTYQHHVIDIAGGFVLATYCFYLFPETAEKLSRRDTKVPPTLGFVRNFRIGIYYTTGALALDVLAVFFWPLGVLIFWPAISLLIAAAGYFGLGSAIFRKQDGRLPWSTRFVLAPCLFGQYLSFLYYRRQCRPWDKVMAGVWIGRKLNDEEARVAIQSGVTAVLDLSAEFSEAAPFRHIVYKNIPILDLTAPTPEQLHEMASFIEGRSKAGVVYVHCKIGYSRSAAAVAAYLIMSGQANGVDGAVAMIRRARPSIVIRPEIVAALQQISRRATSSPLIRTIASKSPTAA